LKIAVGIPAYNEEKNLASIIVKLEKLTHQIIVCDDGSTDLTSDIAKKMGVIVVNHSKNLGYGAAIRTLFLKAKELEVDVLITFDADGQHRVEDINAVLEPIKNGDSEIVIGSRLLKDKSGKGMPGYRKIGIKTITALTAASIEEKITDSQSGFRAYNKRAIQEITPSDSGMGVSTEILIKASKKGLKISEVPIEVLYSGETSTHHPVPHGLSVILSTMKFVSIEHPLKFYGIPGIIFLTLGLFFIVWTLQTFSETRQIITNISLIGIGSIILSMILMMTAILLYSLVSVVRERRSY